MDDYPYEYYNRKRAKRKVFLTRTIVLLSVLALVAVSAVCVFAFSASKARMELPLYLLAADTEEDAERVAEEIAAKGGAGVLYEEAGGVYPLYACYYDGESAEAVSSRLNAAGEPSFVMARGGGTLYFRGTSRKEAKSGVPAALRAVYDCSQVFYAAANGAEGGTGAGDTFSVAEQAARRMRSAFEQAAGGLAEHKKYRGFFSFGEEFYEQMLSAGAYTAGTLRALQAKLCLFYLSAFTIFGK